MRGTGPRHRLRPSTFKMDLRRLGAAGLGVFLLNCGASSPGTPRASFEQPRHDFGLVHQGDKVIHEFPVRNTGNTTLRLEEARLSSSEMTCRFPREIAPGGEAAVTVEWSTAHLQGKVEAEAVVKTNDPTRPDASLVLSGKVEGPIELKPMPAIFLSAFQGEIKSEKLTIINHEARPVSVRLTRPPSSHFTAFVRPVEEGRVFDLVVDVAPGLTRGRYDESVVLDVRGSTLYRLEIPIHLIVNSDVYASPDVVDFGNIPADAIARTSGELDLLQQTILLKKRAGKFRIESLRSDVGALTLKRVPTGPSGTFRIDVGLSRDRLTPGDLRGSIWIDTDDPRFPEIVISVHGHVGS